MLILTDTHFYDMAFYMSKEATILNINTPIEIYIRFKPAYGFIIYNFSTWDETNCKAREKYYSYNFNWH